MSKVSNNIVTQGLSGQLGKPFVFRSLNGKTIVSKSPTVNRQPTDNQMAVSAKFQYATLYAQSRIKLMTRISQIF